MAACAKGACEGVGEGSIIHSPISSSLSPQTEGDPETRAVYFGMSLHLTSILPSGSGSLCRLVPLLASTRYPLTHFTSRVSLSATLGFRAGVGDRTPPSNGLGGTGSGQVRELGQVQAEGFPVRETAALRTSSRKNFLAKKRPSFSVRSFATTVIFRQLHRGSEKRAVHDRTPSVASRL